MVKQCDDLIAKTVNKMKTPCTGLTMFILNIFFPGLGTIISSCECAKGGALCTTTLLVGILQAILTGFLLGWIWSIIWGFMIWNKSK